MTVKQIAKEFKVREGLVYLLIRDLEMTGRLDVPRVNRRVVIDSDSKAVIDKEMQKRGYIREV